MDILHGARDILIKHPLAASAVVAGRENGFSNKNCRQLALRVARAYRQAMARLARAMDQPISSPYTAAVRRFKRLLLV